MNVVEILFRFLFLAMYSLEEKATRSKFLFVSVKLHSENLRLVYAFSHLKNVSNCSLMLLVPYVYTARAGAQWHVQARIGTC